MNAEMMMENIDCSMIQLDLDAYSPELRERAIEAIHRLRTRIRSTLICVSFDTSWFDTEREGIFTITFEAFADRFQVHDIEIEGAPPPERPGAFVVRRGGFVHALRSRGSRDGPSAILLGAFAAVSTHLIETSIVFAPHFDDVRRRLNDSICNADRERTRLFIGAPLRAVYFASQAVGGSINVAEYSVLRTINWLTTMNAMAASLTTNLTASCYGKYDTMTATTVGVSSDIVLDDKSGLLSFTDPGSVTHADDIIDGDTQGAKQGHADTWSSTIVGGCGTDTLWDGGRNLVKVGSGDQCLISDPDANANYTLFSGAGADTLLAHRGAVSMVDGSYRRTSAQAPSKVPAQGSACARLAREDVSYGVSIMSGLPSDLPRDRVAFLAELEAISDRGDSGMQSGLTAKQVIPRRLKIGTAELC